MVFLVLIMFPRHTKYKVAITPDEYSVCHQLRGKDDKLFYPTVMAIRDSKAIGLISTVKGKNNLTAVAMTGNSIFTCIGLYKLYEQTLNSLGIKQYVFSVEEKNKKMINTVEKHFKIKPYAETQGKKDKLLWYIRKL